MKPICPYCDKPAELVTGKVIYPRRPDLFDLQFWLCLPCKAYVGCHKAGVKFTDHRGKQVQSDGTYPLGRLADAELRAAKQEVWAPK